MDTKELVALCDFDTRHLPRPYINAVTAFHPTLNITQETPSDISARLFLAETAGFNVFHFPANAVLVDLLSDSGTTTLTAEQLARMISFLGKEAYGTPPAYEPLVEAMEKTFGINRHECEIFLFHQGRTAEHALFSQLRKQIPPGAMIPSNGHFDTTQANIEAEQMLAINIPTGSKDYTMQKNPQFRGNMDIEALQEQCTLYNKEIPMVYMTITNNREGGRPVSLENMRDARALCDRYKKPLFIDACRFAENAWFIKQHEPAYKNKTIVEIAHEIFALCDGFTISFKKDGLSHMGGALVIRKKSFFTRAYPHILDALRDHQFLTEGNDKQGGMTLWDIASITAGLERVVNEQYLASRIDQIRAFGSYMSGLGIPVLEPFGGHAVYIDVDTFFEGTAMRPEDFGGIALTGLLLLRGVRLCELGAFAFGKWNKFTKRDSFTGRNLVRCAVPRMKYEMTDLKYVADCVRELYGRRHDIPKAIPVSGRELSLRHFKARFTLEKNNSR